VDGRIRVVVADDHEPFRHAFAHLLSIDVDLEVVGQASTGREACELVEALHPDVVFLDLMMPEMDGAEAARQIKRNVPGTKVIILSVFNQEAMIRRGLDAGADRYLTKGISRQELLASVKAVAAEPTRGDRAPHERTPVTGIFGES
jgi:DNA-binding NarL/FixJ family response regulator